MKYWRKYRIPNTNLGVNNFVATRDWYIEDEDGFYTHIYSYPNHAGIKKSTIKPIKYPKEEILKEITKEEVNRGLLLVLKVLDLPKGINFLTHKF